MRGLNNRCGRVDRTRGTKGLTQEVRAGRKERERSLFETSSIIGNKLIFFRGTFFTLLSKSFHRNVNLRGASKGIV